MNVVISLNSTSTKLLQSIIEKNKLKTNCLNKNYSNKDFGKIDINLNEGEFLGDNAKIHIDQIQWSHETETYIVRVVKLQVNIKLFPTMYWENINTNSSEFHVKTCLESNNKNHDFEKSKVINLHNVHVLEAIVKKCA